MRNERLNNIYLILVEELDYGALGVYANYGDY